jgi:hypothetical protein
MTTNAIFIDKDTGLWTHGLVYGESGMPPQEATPPGCVLIKFDETAANYPLIATLILGTGTEDMTKYVPSHAGGVSYDFTTKTFSFALAPTVSVADIARAARNQALEACDHLMLVPDMPDALVEKTRVYRQSLRDITKHLTPDITRIEDLPWPDVPQHHVVTKL